MNNQVNTKVISITPASRNDGAKLKDIRIDRPVKVKSLWLARAIKWFRQLYYRFDGA